MSSPRLTAAAAVLALCAALVSGCTPAEDPTGDPPSVTGTSAPITSPAPATSEPTSASASVSASRDHQALVAQAISQFRRSQELYWQTFKAGGLGPTDPPPQALAETVMGKPFDGFIQAMRKIKDMEVVYESGQTRITEVREDPNKAPDALVAIHACLDATKVRSTVGPTKKPSYGLSVRVVASFKRDRDGVLKLSSQREMEDGSCVK